MTRMLGIGLLGLGVLSWIVAGTSVWMFATGRQGAGILALSAVTGPMGEILIVCGLALLGVRQLQGRFEQIRGWMRRG